MDKPTFVVEPDDEFAPFVLRVWAEALRSRKRRLGLYNEEQQRRYLEAMRKAEQMEQFYQEKYT